MPAVELTTDRRDGVAVVALAGEVDASNVTELRNHLDDLLVQGDHDFVIDLSGVGFIDSSGLATLVQLFKRVRVSQGDVRLCGLQPKVQRVFELIRLDRVFDAYPGPDDAIASYSRLRQR